MGFWWPWSSSTMECSWRMKPRMKKCWPEGRKMWQLWSWTLNQRLRRPALVLMIHWRNTINKNIEKRYLLVDLDHSIKRKMNGLGAFEKKIGKSIYYLLYLSTLLYKRRSCHMDWCHVVVPYSFYIKCIQIYFYLFYSSLLSIFL